MRDRHVEPLRVLFLRYNGVLDVVVETCGTRDEQKSKRVARDISFQTTYPRKIQRIGDESTLRKLNSTTTPGSEDRSRGGEPLNVLQAHHRPIDRVRTYWRVRHVRGE
jgi:hypothetical protein